MKNKSYYKIFIAHLVMLVVTTAAIQAQTLRAATAAS